MENNLVDRLIKILLKKENKKKLDRFYTKYYICIIRADTKEEQLTLYNFFKKIGIRIHFEEKYDSGEWPLRNLMDIWFKQKEPYDPSVNIELWHILQSNIARRKRAIEFKDFENILAGNKYLLDVINKAKRLPITQADNNCYNGNQDENSK